MPQLTLGSSSLDLSKVINAFEDRIGLPRSSRGDKSWLKTILKTVNEAEGTDLAYQSDDRGISISYNSTDSALLLADIRKQNKGL